MCATQARIAGAATCAARLPRMPEALPILVLAALVVVVVLLVLVLRRAGGGDAAAMRAERDRLRGELAHEQAAAREATTALAVARERLATLEAQAAERSQALRGREELLDAERLRATQALADARGAETRREAAQSELARLRAQLDAMQADLQVERDARQAAEGARMRIEEQLAQAERAREATQAFVQDAQARLSTAFAELAGKAFEERGRQFEENVRRAGAASRSEFETLLKPFAEKLGDFRQRVDTLYGDEAKERSQLLGAVTELKTLNQDMAQRAHELTRALKGSAKVRGDWGELMLESVLRSSGLEEGVHFERQAHAVDDEGARLRPDVVVRLPDERRVVIDSKCNLVAWQEAMNAETPELQTDALRRHAAALRVHVRELGEKNYPKAVGRDALGVTVAFVPIEGALSAALGSDVGLQDYAFERHIVLTTPNTLMGMLRVIERMWTRDRLQRTALEISEAGGKVLDALMGFLEDFDNVGKKLDDAQKAFGSARTRLSESTHAVIPRARKLVEKGVRGKKRLSDELRVGVDDDDCALPLLGDASDP